ncbi:IucA/IucC family siderophore biosynthesis protein [Cyanobacteria bacterium FACHB-472]|nr:IucA/IucC family siderophore biosynthesis protein [Cyanobacteria bacterium FACHB-472]
MTENTISKPTTPQLDINLTDKQISEQATIQSFFNCYLRETYALNQYKIEEPQIHSQADPGNESQRCLYCNLPHQGVKIVAYLRYFSPTGRHIFSFPLYYQPGGKKELIQLDYITLVALIAKELSLSSGSNGNQDELLLRTLQSCRNIEQFVRNRRRDAELLYAFNSSFIETEQALVFGHLMHPTPKSRQGFSEDELFAYSPELKGNFPLHYFRAHCSIVQEGSALEQTATNLIKAELLADAAIDAEFKTKYCGEDEYTLLPVHPWQANFMMRQPAVQKLLERGLLEDLKLQGRAYLPTSSVRTVYHPDAAFMLKLSLNVKITNSLRTNLYKELERSVEVYQIMASQIGKDLRQNFPNFNIIRDPAYITLKIDGEPADGFATILRENPFQANPATDASCLIALCQDSIFGDGSRLAQIIRQLAKQEQRSTSDISLDWFRRYLKISLEPILWLYFTYGIGVEAHQQNSVLQLQDGYPYRFFYRDNQGYYYRQSFHQKLDSLIPGIGEKSQTFCEDAVIDERLGYYLFMNNILGIINAFGVAELVDENLLLSELRTALEKQTLLEQGCSNLLPNLLSQPQLRCKGNLLTRFHDMDELVGSVATQSVYVTIDNSLYVGNGGVHVAH